MRKRKSLSKRLFTPARLTVLSGLFANLSAGWIGAVLIFPNFSSLYTLQNKILLTLDIVAAIVCLLIAFWLEDRSRK